MDTKKLPDVFVSYAADTLAETNSGLTGTQIVKYCNSYAVDFGVDIPITSSNFGSFGSLVPNKRTALYRNLSAFNGKQQFVIIKEEVVFESLIPFSAYQNFVLSRFSILFLLLVTPLVFLLI